MKRLTTIILLSLFVAVSAVGQAPKTEATPLPSVDQVIENYVKALGGKDAIMKVTSRLTKGTFDFPAVGVSGAPAEFYAKAPNKSGFSIDVAGYGVVQEGFNGTVAWAQSPETGLREKTGAELADAKLDNDFYGDLNLKQRYPKMEVKGKEKVGTREAYLIVASRPEGSPDKFYFDAQTWLLIRSDAERETPQGKALVESYLDDYRDIDGVKIPHANRLVSPMGEFIFKFTEVKQNVPIDDAKFNKPAGQ